MTITAKIILAYTVVFGLTLAGFAFVIYQNSKKAELGKLDARMENHANKVQAEIEEQKSQGAFPAVGTLSAIRTEGLHHLRFRLLDKNGKLVLGDTSLAGLSLEPWPDNQSVSPRWGFVKLKGHRQRSLWMPVEVDDRIEFLAQFVVPLTEVEENLQRLRLLFLVVGPAALLLTAGAAFFITRIAFKPISSMVETARSITAAKLDSRLTVPRTKDEIRKLAETLNEMMERIDAAFRTQRQFVADASHEIRTPLTIIRSELEFAERNLGKPQSEESIRVALRELERLARLSDGLLMLARLDAPGFSLTTRTIRLDELLIECVRHMNESAARRRVTLDIRVEEAVELPADRDRLKSVLLNLLDNAIHYSPEGGTIRLSLTAVSNGNVRVTVEDSGPGIAPSDLPHIFKRFYRADTERSREGGSGLGLAIADQVVRLHGGRITVESTLGKGSKFVVELPT
jgi:signal transduction histidine kinase